MKKENLVKYPLPKLKELLDTLTWLSDKYARELTTYATDSGDKTFINMDPRTRHIADKRIRLISFIEVVSAVIEEKITNIITNDDVELD